MHLLSRGELRRAMLAQLAGQQCGGLHEARKGRLNDEIEELKLVV
jgi:hypothetical protein